MNEAFNKKGNDLLSRKCSTIGAGRLNFSVRNGKRWNPTAVATLSLYRFVTRLLLSFAPYCLRLRYNILELKEMLSPDRCTQKEPFGQLVLLGFDVAIFTPTAYQRCNLQRPYKDISSWGGLRA